jgi:hypothetical protein
VVAAGVGAGTSAETLAHPIIPPHPAQQSNNPEWKAELKDLYIVAAKEVPVGAKTNAIVVVVPYKLLKAYHKIQQRLVRELEKKFRSVLCFYLITLSLTHRSTSCIAPLCVPPPLSCLTYSI